MGTPEAKIDLDLSEVTKSLLAMAREAQRAKKEVQQLLGKDVVKDNSNIKKELRAATSELKKLRSSLNEVKTAARTLNRTQKTVLRQTRGQGQLLKKQATIASSVSSTTVSAATISQAGSGTFVNSASSVLATAGGSIGGANLDNVVDLIEFYQGGGGGPSPIAPGSTHNAFFAKGQAASAQQRAARIRALQHGRKAIRKSLHTFRSLASGNIAGVGLDLLKKVPGLLGPAAAGFAIGSTVAHIAQSYAQDAETAATAMSNQFGSETMAQAMYGPLTNKRSRIVAREASRTRSFRGQGASATRLGETPAAYWKRTFGFDGEHQEQITRYVKASVGATDLARKLGYSEKFISDKLMRSNVTGIDLMQANREQNDSVVARTLTNLAVYTGQTGDEAQAFGQYVTSFFTGGDAAIKEKAKTVARERMLAGMKNDADRRNRNSMAASEIVNKPETGQQILDARRAREWLYRVNRPMMPALVRD